MGFRSGVLLAIFFSLVSGPRVEATVTVTKVNQATQETNTHFAAGLSTSAVALASGFIDPNNTLFRLDKTYANETEGARSNMIVFDVYSDEVFSVSGSNKLVLLVSLHGNNLTNSGDEERLVYLPIAAAGATTTAAAALTGCLSSSTCFYNDMDPADDVVGQTDYTEFSSYRFGVQYTSGSPIRIGLYPHDICSVLGDLSSSPGLEDDVSDLCDGESNDEVYGPDEKGSVLTFNLDFTIRVATSDSDLRLAASASEDTSATQSMKFYGEAPTPSSCVSADMYFPGDQEILVKTGNISATQESAGAPFSEVVVIARNSANGSINATSSFRTGNDIISTVAYNSGEKSVTGFSNTTNLTDNSYEVAFAMKDKAGLVSEFSGTNCQLTGVFTAEINGFLRNSDCFVATASYGDQNVFPVQILRELRNRVLLKTEIGRWFIQKYYKFGPQAAIWLRENPAWRGPILLLLSPLQIWSWLGMNLLAWAEESPSQQPFIDQVKKEIREEGEPVDEGSFIERKKREILENAKDSRTEETGSFIERVKRSDPEKFGQTPRSDDANPRFLESEKAKILEKEKDPDYEPLPESAIEAAKSGESELRLIRKGKIKGAMGLRVGATFSDSITASGGYSTGRSFSDVYGSAYRPDISVFYEYQFFHSEWVGSLGLMGMVGASFMTGQGTFAFDLPVPGGGGTTFGTTSRTSFTFLTIPMVVAANYRFNLLRVLRPFVAVGPALIPFLELRSDSKSGQRGYSKAIYGSVGVSLLLDWLSRRSSWQLYESGGVKHYYLTVEYSLLKSFASNVTIDRQGVVAGLAFEI